MTFEDQLYEKFGDSVKIVRYLEDGTDRAVISYGEYEYIISTKRYVYIKHFASSSMTKESKIKRINKKSCYGVELIDIEKIDNKTIGHFLHIDTGRVEKRLIFYKNIESIFKDVCKRCLMDKMFIEKAKNKFGDLISYEKTKYIRSKIETTFTCRIHGDFLMKPGSLMSSHCGCPKCGRIKPIGLNNFSKTSFERKCIDNIGYLYVVLCFNETETFIKIGITSNKDISKRLSKANKFPYNFKELAVMSSDPDTIFSTEKTLHKKYKEFKYVPKIKFGGCNECFDISIKQEAIEYIQNKLLNL